MPILVINFRHRQSESFFDNVIFEDHDWWKSKCPEVELSNLENSAKLILLFEILQQCQERGEKLLVFSQSIFSLDVIEYFLQLVHDNTQKSKIDARLCGFTGNWQRDIDYFRLDGSKDIDKRVEQCNTFNNEEDKQAR